MDLRFAFRPNVGTWLMPLPCEVPEAEAAVYPWLDSAVKMQDPAAALRVGIDGSEEGAGLPLCPHFAGLPSRV